MADKCTARLRFSAAKQTRALDVQLGRILEMQHQTIVFLSEHLERGEDVGIMEVAEHDDRSPAL